VYRPATADSPSAWVTGFNRESTRDALPDNQVNAVVGDSKGRVWLGTSRGAAVFTPDESAFALGAYETARWQSFDQPATPLTGESVHAIAEDGRGRLYFGTRKGVVVLDESQTDPAQRWGRLGAGPDARAGLPDPWVQALVFGPDGRLWAGTRRGLAVYDPARPQDGWRAYRANTLRRLVGRFWPALWERNIIGDDVTALAWG
jgi:ligand-binding sensor domain-containing protein